MDFLSLTQATAALIHPGNHYLNGRALVLEYASADAARRGGGQRGEKRNSDPARTDKSRHGFKRPFAEQEAKPEIHDVKAITDSGEGEKKHKPNKEERAALRAQKAQQSVRGGRDDRSSSGRERRLKPGAALARAQRASTGIVEGLPQGKKVTFD